MPTQSALTPETLSSLIADIYDCALEPAKWPIVFTRLATELDAAYATMSLAKANFTEPRMAVHSPWDPVMLKILNEEFGPDGVPGLLDVMRGDVDVPRSTLDQMSEADFHLTRFYQEWVRPQGLRDACVMKVVDTADRLGILAAITRADRDIVTADERRYLSLVSPHIRRAAMISDLMDHQRVAATLYKHALDRLAAPIFLVNGDARIQHANAAGESFLAAQVSILSKSGQLQPANPAMRPAFSDAILRACTSSAGLGSRGIGIPVSAEGHPPAVAYVLPLSGGAASSTMPSAAVFIASSLSSAPPPNDVLATLFDLTPGEARVMLQIGSGQTLQATAAALGIVESTAKTHLARIFSKTGMSRQADLVKAVSALSPPVS